MKLPDIQRISKRIKKKNAIILLIFAIGLMYVLFDSRGLFERIRLSSEKATLERKIARLEAENDSIRVEIKKLQTSDQEIERIAREKYFMHRNGEKIIKVQPR